MGAPPLVMGDKITGTCVGHLAIGPLGVPVAAPPLPFAASIALGLSPNVNFGGKAAATAGASGQNGQPHAGLHASDPCMLPTAQIGHVVSGSATVLINGKPAATQQSRCTCCVVPGNGVPSVMTVLIG